MKCLTFRKWKRRNVHFEDEKLSKTLMKTFEDKVLSISDFIQSNDYILYKQVTMSLIIMFTQTTFRKD